MMEAEKAKRNFNSKKTIISTTVSDIQITLIKVGRKKKSVKSVTRDEIDRYWEMKKMKEEEHLLAALKAAARIKARNLSEEEYRRFEESLRDVIKLANDADHSNKELQFGIKDWWTKSKYAYLNEPPISAKKMMEGSGRKKATSTYVPQKICSYSPVSYFPTAAFGVF